MKILFLQKLLVLTAVALPCLSAVHSASAGQVYQYMIDGKVISGDAYDAITKGQQFLHANNNADAILMLQKAASLAPDVADIHNNLGIALAKSGQPDAAIQEFELARKLNPSLDAPWMSLAGMYQSVGQIDKAIETYKGFLTRFPKHRDAGKIASLVQGLEKEQARQQASGGTSLDNDYFAEVTRDGIIRWSTQRMPLRVYIGQGDGVPGYVPEYRELLKQSFVDWAQVSSGLISCSFVEQPGQADITCAWSSDPTRFKNIAEAGETFLYSNKSGLVKGTITLLTVPLVPDLPLTRNRMRSICVHEVGHVLGLAGHSSTPQDAMFHTTTVADLWKDLSQRDANTIVKLYSKQPVARYGGWDGP